MEKKCHETLGRIVDRMMAWEHSKLIFYRMKISNDIV